MRTYSWLIGCALGIACIGYTHATDLASQDLDNGAHAAATDNSAGCPSGDDLGLSHNRSPQSSNDDSNNASTSSSHSSGGSATPAPSSQPRVGWQSLLPGSIQ